MPSILHAETMTKGAFLAAYPSVRNPAYEPWRTAFMEAKYLEQLSDGFNRLIPIPRIVTISIRECGVANAYYQPAKGSLSELVMCYELLDHFKDVFVPYYPDQKRQGQLVMGAWFFVFLHELGHTLVHQLDLPITGKEEDAVDQLSTVLLTRSGANGEIAALGGALWFRLAAHQARSRLSLQNLFGQTHYNFSDEHSLHEQRFYNVLCWLYGYNPEAFSFAIKDGTLPAHRAQRCEHEYQQMLRTWERLLPQLKASTE